MTNEELMTEHFSHVYGVALHLGARFIFPGEVGHLGGNSLVIGRYLSGLDETAEQVVAALQAANMGGTLTDDILACKWAKFCINLMNAPAAILDRSGPELLNDLASRRLCGDMLAEAQHALARAEIKLKTLPGDQPLPDMVTAFRQTDFTPQPLPARSTHVFPSMWQDVFCRRGRTEARYLKRSGPRDGTTARGCHADQRSPHPGGRHHGGATGTAGHVYTGRFAPHAVIRQSRIRIDPCHICPFTSPSQFIAWSCPDILC